MDHLIFFSAVDNNDYNNNNNNNMNIADDNMHNIDILLYPDAVCLNQLTQMGTYNKDPRFKASVIPQPKAGHTLEEQAVQNA